MRSQVTVFHTSDLHNKLSGHLADGLRQLKSETPGSLMLDSGDAIWAGNIFWRPGGEPILDLMNSVPYDAMCLGNREFHFLAKGLAAKTAKARFPILSANLRLSSLDSEPPVKPWVILNTPEARVGVIGLSVPCITEDMPVRKLASHYFEKPIEAAARVVPQVRRDCDVLIALTHIGIARDRELAEKVPGIDVILGGHTHTVTGEPEVVGQTHILHHGAFGHYVGKVEIRLEGKRMSVTNELIPLAKA